MRLNILIVFFIGVLAYVGTLAFDHYTREPAAAVVQAPVEEEVSKNIQVPIVPDFTAKTVSGEDLSFHDFKGKVIILNFWASWCPPCIGEMPVFVSLAKMFGDEIVFVGISSDYEAIKMNEFLDKLDNVTGWRNQKNIVFIHDSKGDITQGLFKTFRYPETLIIAPDLTVHQKIVGATWNKDEVTETLKRLSAQNK